MFQLKKIKDKVEQAVYEKQVDLIYQSLPFSLLTTVVVICLLLFFLRDTVPFPALTMWTVGMGAVVCLRFATVGLYFFQRNEEVKKTGFFEFLLVIGVILAGASWGSAGIWLYALADLGSRFLIIVVLVGVAASPLGMLSYRIHTYLFFIGFILFPLMVGVNLAGESQRLSISITIVLFFLFGYLML